MLYKLQHSVLPHGYLAWRRVTECLMLGLAMPLLAVIAALAALCIFVETGRPVLFVQARPGRDGKLFRLIKFRSMRCDADSERLSRPGDERVTRVGALLRRWRIDELPQVLNILRGEMSLIGPRPEPAHLSERFEREIPGFGVRRLLRPGITGLAQMRQGYTLEDIPSNRIKLEHDLYYLSHLSLRLDLLILSWSFRPDRWSEAP